MPGSSTVVPGSRGGQSRWARFVSTEEQYGSAIVRQFASRIEPPAVALDIGAGAGRDLGIVKSAHPSVKTIAVECYNTESLRQRFDAVY